MPRERGKVQERFGLFLGIVNLQFINAAELAIMARNCAGVIVV